MSANTKAVEDDRSRKRAELAHKLYDACQSEVWRTVFLPYFEGEQRVEIENMASHTDPLQLMRSAGAVQALRKVMETESTAKRVIEDRTEKKLSEFK